MSLNQIPDEWCAGLTKLKGKVPVEKDFNGEAVERYKHGTPRSRARKIHDWVEQGHNVGLVPPKGIVVLDCDDSDAIKWVQKYASEDTPCSWRTQEHAHYYFRYKLPVGREFLSKSLEAPNGGILDLRVHGKSQAVVPPSTHASGINSKWLVHLPETINEVPQMPRAMMKALTKMGALPDGKTGEVPDGHAAHDTVRSWSLARVDSVDSLQELMSLTRDFAETYVAPTRPERFERMVSGPELKDLVEGAWARRGKMRDHRMTDLGAGDDRYCYAWDNFMKEGWHNVSEWSAEGQWVKWNGAVWAPWHSMGPSGFDGAIRRLSKTLRKEARTDSPKNPDHEEYTEALQGMTAALSIQASSFGPISRLTSHLARPSASFNQRHELWTTIAHNDHPAKVLNFKNVSVQKPKRSMMLTRQGGSPLIPGHHSKLWENFIAEAFPDEELRRFVQICAGYTMLGDPREEIVLFLIGRGGSGKGTFISTLEKVFGDFAGVIPAAEIDDRTPGTGSGAANGTMIGLQGKRLATCVELPDRVMLQNKLKGLTGGDTQSSRALYARVATEFTPQFVLWLGANFQPASKAVDTGLIRRMRYIPMEAEPKRVNVRLKQQLSKPENLAGVLTWALEGLQIYMEEGRIVTPEAVLARSLQARVESSDLGPWLDEMVILDDAAEGFTAAEGMKSYKEWFHEMNGSIRGIPVRNAARFGGEMGALNRPSVKSNGIRRYRGLRILTSTERMNLDALDD